MAKLTLNNISSGYLATTLINANNDVIELAFENTLSRDGTSPNTMGANLDMNSYRITNLAQPTNASDAVRYSDLQVTVADVILASQTGNSGKVLTTDGTVTSWTAAPALAGTNFTGTATSLTAGHATDAALAGAVGSSGLTQSTAKLLGRTTASTGAIEQIGISGDLLFSSTTLSPYPQGVVGLAQNACMVAVCSTNRLVITVPDLLNANISTSNPLSMYFRSETITSGVGVRTTVTSGNMGLIVPDTALLGTINGQAARLWVALVYASATSAEVAVYNALSGTFVSGFNEGGLISTTAISTGSDNAQTWYSTTSLTNKPFVIVGYIEITEATAGTWASQPTAVVSNPRRRPGQIVQQSPYTTSATTSGAGTIAHSATIPTSSDGNLLMTHGGITPSFAGNLLEIDVNANVAESAAVNCAFWLCQDATSNALRTVSHTIGSAQWNQLISFSHAMVARTASSTVFKLYGGGTSGTTYLNGDSGGQMYGTSGYSSLRIKEIFV